MADDGPIRIIHMIPHDGVGGVEVAARRMAETVTGDCVFELLLVAGNAVSADRARIIESPFGSALNPLAQLRAFFISLRCKPDVLVFSLWRTVPVAMLVWLFTRKTRLVFFLNVDRAVHLPDSILSRLAIRFADEVWADSAATLQARLRPGGSASRVISFVTQRFVPAANSSPQVAARFVTWSRLNRQKGIDRALEFIAALRARGVDASFDIWGPDGGEQARLAALSHDLGLDGHAMFRGPFLPEELPEVAAGHDFFLQLSRFEGMAMGAVEAMQLGLVPVVTPVGEMANYVVDGVNGISVDAEKPEAALSSVQQLLADRDRYREMRAQAVARWRDAPLYAEDICAAARELVGRKRHE